METPEKFVEALFLMSINKELDLKQWANHFRERDAAIRAECAEKLHEVMLQKLHIDFPTRMLGVTAQYYHDEFEKQFQVYRAAIMAEPPKVAL